VRFGNPQPSHLRVVVVSGVVVPGADAPLAESPSGNDLEDIPLEDRRSPVDSGAAEIRVERFPAALVPREIVDRHELLALVVEQRRDQARASERPDLDIRLPRLEERCRQVQECKVVRPGETVDLGEHRREPRVTRFLRARVVGKPLGQLAEEAIGIHAQTMPRRDYARRGLKPRSRSEFVTTKTLENAIAAPAIIGFR
jgi:hypothetical protein